MNLAGIECVDISVSVTISIVTSNLLAPLWRDNLPSLGNVLVETLRLKNIGKRLN